MNTLAPRPRMAWLDFLKLIAIFLMISNHCTDNVHPSQRCEEWYNVWGSFYNTFTRSAIPLFVMVTGVLLLPVKESDFVQFWKKRVSRLVIPFLVWSLIYNLFPFFLSLFGCSPADVNIFFAWVDPNTGMSEMAKRIAEIPLTFSLYAVQMWYIFVLIGIYLYLPFFSAWVKQASKREMQLFLLVWVVTLFIPYIRQYLVPNLWGECSWNEFGMLYYFAGFNGYLLLGHYFVKYPLQWSWLRTLAVCVPMYLVGYTVTFVGFKTITAEPTSSEAMVELFFTVCSPNALLMTIPLFLMAQKLPLRSEKLCAILRSVSICTFGIWMCHYLFVGPIYDVVELLGMHTLANMIVSSALVTLAAWAFVAAILRWIPGAKWFMG
ncbi:MAG: acyltransferase family protein [Akkermansia sp.]